VSFVDRMVPAGKDVSLVPISFVHFRMLAFGFALDIIFNPNGLISFVNAAHHFVDRFCLLSGANDRMGEIKAITCPNLDDTKNSTHTILYYLRMRVAELEVEALNGFVLPMPLGVLVHVNLFPILLEGVEALFAVYSHLELICAEFAEKGIASCKIDSARLSIVWETELIITRVSFSITKDMTIHIEPTQTLVNMSNICPISIANCEILSVYLTKKVSVWLN
jgi:hypothetical protein